MTPGRDDVSEPGDVESGSHGDGGNRLAVGLGGFVAALLVVVTVVVVSSSASPTGHQVALPPPIVTAPTAPTSTTPSTAVAVAAPPSTIPVPTLPPSVAVDLPIDGSGAILHPPSSPDVRVEDAPNDCASLVDNGWQSIDCKVVTIGDGGLTYLIEALPAPSYVATRAYVFRQRPGGSEQLVLAAEDDQGTKFESSEVEAAVAPTSPGRTPIIVIGFLGGNSTHLAIDVVEGPGTVVVHQDLGDGLVETGIDELQTWGGSSRPGAPPFIHDTIRHVGSVWRIVAQQTVPSVEVPRSANAVA